MHWSPGDARPPSIISKSTMHMPNPIVNHLADAELL